MNIPESAFGPISLTIAQGIGAFQMFLPKLTDIHHANPSMDTQMIADVRLGELGACALLLGLGFMTSLMIGDTIPLVVAILAGAGLVAFYEYALQRGGS